MAVTRSLAGEEPELAPRYPVLGQAEAIARAKELAPKLRERAEATEALRRIPDESIRDLIESGLFGIATPRRWGGSELGYATWIKVTAEIAAACPSTGWVFGVLLGHSWLVARFPVDAQREVFSDPNALVASLFRLRGSPEATAGGYRWRDGGGRFCSGVDHAAWVISIGSLPSDDGRSDPRYFLLSRRDFDIVDDWFTVGMRGTGSKSIRLRGEPFIPGHRSIPVGGLGGGGFTTSLIGAPLGIARGAVDIYEETVRQRLQGATPEQGALEAPRFVRLGQAAADIDFAYTVALAGADILDGLEEAASLTEIESARYRRNQAYAVHLCRLAVNSLFEASGGTGIYETALLQGYWRDINAAAAHTSNDWENAAVGYAYATLGLERPRPGPRGV